MRIGLAGSLAAAVMFLAGAASAAECDRPERGANLFPLTTANQIDTNIATRLMTTPQLRDALRSEAEVLSLPRVCERGGFQIGGVQYRLFGTLGTGDAPARFAVRTDGKGPVLYLLPLTLGGERSWVVTVTEGDVAALAAGADAMPTDDQLLHLFASTLRNEYRRAVGLNLKTGSILVYAAPKAPPKSAGSAPTPPPGATGGGQPLVLDAPDGTIFIAAPEDGVRHALTGMVCPAEVGGFKRERIVVYDAAGGGRDVSCRFSIGRSYMTLYLTRLPGSMSGEEVFDSYARSARTVAPPVADRPSPLPIGKPPAPAFEDFWSGTRGQVDGLWMVQIGPWFIKVRATYEPEDEALMREAAGALFEQLHRQVRPPEI